MPRPLRLQFADAIYHVINRGNYRRPIFESVGARKAFLKALDEAVVEHGWLLHAYVLLNNHFHLALETPRANLSEGMHWLQSTFATRFNRFRCERGHLFQGRFQALLVEPGPALARVVNYVHLNPVRAGLVSVTDLPNYPWGSLPRFINAGRPGHLLCDEWLRELGLTDSPDGWQRYRAFLAELANDPARQEADGFEAMTLGWSIGRDEWRQAIAAEYRAMPVLEAPYGPERDAIREAEWSRCLDALMREVGRTRAEALATRKGVPWKVEIAACMRRESTATHRWLARELGMGRPAALRVLLSRARRAQ